MVNFEVISKQVYDDFLREYGEKKTRKITALINKSKYTGNLMYQSRSRRFVPTAKDFGMAVLGNLSMSFARPSTVKFASFLLLDKWNKEINQELYLASDQHLINILVTIREHVH